MKTAVVTITVGPTYQFFASLTHPSIKAYADKIGSDFIVIDKSTESTPHWSKFKIAGLLNKYDRIIYIDTDAIVREDCPNLFDIVPESRLGAYNEGAIMEREQAMRDISAAYQVPVYNWNKKYYNTGVMVISRRHKDLFRKPEKEFSNYYEQSYLNLQIIQREISMFDLHYDFNRMYALDKETGIHRLCSYIVHYAGVLNDLNKIIPNDLMIWQKGEWKDYKQHILLNVGASRLGDNINTEPVVRHIVEYHKDAHIVIATTNPEIFKHLEKKAVVTEISNFVMDNDTPYLMVNLSPDEVSPLKKYIDGSYMHGVDYASLVALKRILPDADKQIKLEVTATGVAEVIDITGQPPFNMVLVHPGVSWKSKTFPAKFWDETIAGLVSAELKVGVIGSTMSLGRGVADVKIPDGVTDFRDLLSLEGLFALISMAKVLISNDSAPIHVAGAFDNFIILLPSCKHPDLVLPYRKGAKYHRVAVLGRKIPTLVPDLLNRTPSLEDADATEYMPASASVVSVTERLLSLDVGKEEFQQKRGDELYTYKDMKIWDFENVTSPQSIFDEVLDRDIYGLANIKFEPGDVVVDVGANVGIFSIWVALRNPQIVVHAFESAKSNYDHMVRNIAENGLTNVIPHHMAITDDNRDIKTIVIGGNTGGADIFQKTGEEAKSIRLDDFLENEKIERVKLLKVDCEGAEYEIFLGLKNWQKIEHLSAEIHAVSHYYYPMDYSQQQILDHLKINAPDATLRVH